MALLRTKSGGAIRRWAAKVRWLTQAVRSRVDVAIRWANRWRRSAPLPPYVRLPSRWKLWPLALAALLFCFFWGFAFGLLAPVLIAPLAVPLVVLAGLVLWALPETGRAPTSALQALFFAFLFSVVMWPNYLAVALPGLPRVTILRLVGLPLTLTLLCCVSMSAKFRSEMGEVLRATRFLLWAVLLFYGIQVASVLFSHEPVASLNALVNVSLEWIVIYFTSIYICKKDGYPERVAVMICFMAVALCFLGEWEHLLHRLPWAGHVPGFLKVDDPVVERILAGSSRSGKAPRVAGTFSTSLGLSEYLALATPFLLHFGLSAYRPAARLGALLAVPLVVWTVLLTQARIGLVGIFGSLLLFPTLKLLLYWLRNPKSFGAAAAILLSPLAIAAAGAGALTVPGIRIRLLGGGVEQLSNQGRVDQLQMGLPKVLAHPWGYGIGRGAITLGYSNAAGMLTIDSYPLRLALEYGVAGLIAFYFMFVMAGLYGAGVIWKFRMTEDKQAGLMAAICAALLSYVIMQTVLAQEDNQALVYLLFGMTGAIYFRAFPRRHEDRPIKLGFGTPPAATRGSAGTLPVGRFAPAENGPNGNGPLSQSQGGARSAEGAAPPAGAGAQDCAGPGRAGWPPLRLTAPESRAQDVAQTGRQT